MASVTVGAHGDFGIRIDADADGSANVFVVDHDTAGASAKQLFLVGEDGNVLLGPPAGGVAPDLRRAGPIVFENTSGSGDIMEFLLGGATVASISSTGLGVFELGGVAVPILNHDPNGADLGTPGQVVGSDYGGARHIHVCDAGTTWKAITLA